ncbi:multidrug efflux pump [Paenalcaligenes hominis]|uniref:Multidrug efflux pump n=1 Tax=Paenalcaligenes hominis TaxID=643674 RepID=A0ABX0WS54_9BURK|nr:efflux RND transporter permease subunit [Paenalcaligenes hominis]NJB65599.1 multidrug efflux pump [Paenalcaligenes hominis]GGE64486.1 acriflavine resistance protein B [Paenalcaligenes hominis]
MKRWLTLFIMRPVATTLLCIAMVFSGLLALSQLPVAPLPQMDFPMISVSANLPGASPETMASSVATPLEQALGAISGLSEMSSRSSEGSTRITLMFDLERDINEAARDVQGAINQAMPMMPSGMRGVPSYFKVNPSAAPIMVLAMTSPVATQGQLYDMATTIVAQKLAQVRGVGQVDVGGGSLPAVRISVNPQALAVAGLALDDIRTALNGANPLRPNGYVENDDEQWWLSTNRQMNQAQQIAPLIIGWNEDSAIRLQDVATVEDSVEDINNLGYVNNQEAVLLIVRRQADANIIETVEDIRARIPQLEAMLPSDVRLQVAQDRTPSIRATLTEAQTTLFIAVGLVVLVVLLFLRDWRAALIPAVAVPASLISTFALMYFFGFTLNTISLMALIVATGFVVDDAIVVLESIMRYLEQGLSPLRAAARGVRTVGFTVTAMSLSLVAVFIPLWLVGGLVGRLFKEFAVTLSVAVMISWLISLMLTPMMAARLLRSRPHGVADRATYALERVLLRCGAYCSAVYKITLTWALRYRFLTLLSLLATIALNGYLYATVPKGLFPQQDTGQLMGFFRTDRGMSFEAMKPKLDAFRQIIQADPAVQNVAVFAGGRGGSNSSTILVELVPLDQRDVSALEVVARLRNQLQSEPGARLFLTPQQDIFVGGGLGRSGSYSYSLLGSELSVLKEWQPKVQRAMAALPELTDVDADSEDKGARIELVIDREKATSLGIDMALVASTLNSAFSQRQVGVVYGRLNQYYIVMGVEKRFSQDIEALQQLEVVTHEGKRIPLSVFTHFEHGNAPLSVSHQGLFIAESVSFGLADGVSLDQAVRAIDEAMARISLPTHQIQAGYEGSARMMQQAIAQQPMLILAALAVMYIVLGMLYESYMHPLTILSTLPSAGIGALLALKLVNEEFSIIAMIGVFLLIGIVKKNAIMMVDYALHAQRDKGLAVTEAAFEACMVRFRPIMMTTISAILGAVPLIIATGPGVEMRQPLGLTIVGGLIVSQLLTLYTTPVVYIYLERIAQFFRPTKKATV